MKRSMLSLTILFAITCLSLASFTSAQAITPPLHTSGYQILDAKNHPVRLNSLNWYGFDEKEFVVGGLDKAPLATIISQIQKIGVNSIRLPWANETLESDPQVPDYALVANPQLKGKHAMAIMDIVIRELSRAHIMVILDNHVSTADWCCSEVDGNGLWYNDKYPETKWLADWKTIATRYKNNPWVVGADLRNELRNGAAWGGNDPKLDWHAAAERGGNAVLEANPRLLIMVESPEYSTNFTGFDKLPVKLKTAARLVYSPHAYYSAEHPFATYEEMKQVYDARAGFLLHSEPAVPLWVGEFGTCQSLDCGANADWFRMYIRYMQENDLAWSYWPLNGTQSGGVGRKFGAVETYGLLSTDYKEIAAPKVVELLKTVETQPKK
jgi:endoglucanase